MSHAFVAACASVVLYGCVRLLAGRATLTLVVASGAALGGVVLARPLCAVAVGAVLVFAATSAVRRGRVQPARAAVLFVPALVGAALLLGYNAKLTGGPTRFLQDVWFDEHLPPFPSSFFNYHPGCNALGFGGGCDASIRGGRHDLANALSNTGDNLTAWIWLAGSGPMVFVFACVGIWRRPLSSTPLVALVALVVALYALYWSSGACFGARFYHAALPALLVLAALGLRDLRARYGVRPFVVAMATWVLFNATMLGLAGREIIGENRAYWGVDARFARVAARWNDGAALVLVAFRHASPPDRPSLVFTSPIRNVNFSNSVRAMGALAQNDAKLEGRVVFAKYHPALVPELRSRFPTRMLWLYVVEDDRARGWEGDTLVKLADTPLAEIGRDLPRPVENFDAFAFGE
jgi:hypothetical protein